MQMKVLYAAMVIGLSTTLMTGCLDSGSDSGSVTPSGSDSGSVTPSEGDYSGKTSAAVLGSPDEVNEILQKTLFADQGLSTDPSDVENISTVKYALKNTVETGGSYTGACGGTREVVLDEATNTFTNTFADYCREYYDGTKIVYNGQYTYTEDEDGVETQVFTNFSEVIAEYKLNVVLNGESVWTPSGDYEGTSLTNLTTTDRTNNIQYSLVDFETIVIEYDVDGGTDYETFDSKGRMFQSELGMLKIDTLTPMKHWLDSVSDELPPVEGKIRLIGDRSYILLFKEDGYELGEEDGTTGNFKAGASKSFTYDD
ncbi:MAG: hypothetical protein IBX55_22135 [Methyloprofundus sp.]|nr:hypothetical protein [Methyloprofundus sp.]